MVKVANRLEAASAFRESCFDSLFAGAGSRSRRSGTSTRTSAQRRLSTCRTSSSCSGTTRASRTRRSPTATSPRSAPSAAPSLARDASPQTSHRPSPVASAGAAATSRSRRTFLCRQSQRRPKRATRHPSGSSKASLTLQRPIRSQRSSGLRKARLTGARPSGHATASLLCVSRLAAAGFNIGLRHGAVSNSPSILVMANFSVAMRHILCIRKYSPLASALQKVIASNAVSKETPYCGAVYAARPVFGCNK
eukprot:6189836-Pleurochrysis_carterae.AAC.3